jgi:DNA gyrase/topoisomerase IV subunit B
MDGSVTVEDNGRGIPVGIHKKEAFRLWGLLMTKIGAGVFDKDSYIKFLEEVCMVFQLWMHFPTIYSS